MPLDQMKELFTMRRIYTKPTTYGQFVTDLKSACTKGDNQSKALIEQHAPQMARVLKKEEQWDRPSLCISRPANKDLTIVMESDDMTVENDVFDKVIELTLDGQSVLASPNDLTDDITDDIDEAVSIMLTGGDDDGESECSTQNV